MMWIGKKLICIVIGIIGIIAILGVSGVVVASMDTQGLLGVVVVDAGHGGIDGGVTHGALKESVINLEIATMLASELKSRDIKVFMTRTSEHALGATKKDDMKRRAKIINDTKPNIIVSIHVNKWKSSDRRGAQVFYDDSKRGKEIGVRAQSALNTYINSKYCGRNDLTSLGGDYFITKCSPYPSIIVETAFISNEKDRELLASQEYRLDLVSTLGEVISAIMQEEN